MRRKSQYGTGVSSSDVLINMSETQLALIGAVAMAYNLAESHLHEMVGSCLRYPGPSWDVVSRINGAEGMVQIIVSAVEHLNVPLETREAFEATLNDQGFLKLKGLRDVVVHARIFDAGTAVGHTPKRRGKKEDILLTAEALGGLYLKLQHLGMEMFYLKCTIDCANRLRQGPLKDEQRLRLEGSVREWTERAISLQTLRLSIPVSAKFPDPPHVHEFPPQSEISLLKPVLRAIENDATERPGKKA